MAVGTHSWKGTAFNPQGLQMASLSKMFNPSLFINKMYLTLYLTLDNSFTFGHYCNVQCCLLSSVIVYSFFYIHTIIFALALCTFV